MKNHYYKRRRNVRPRLSRARNLSVTAWLIIVNLLVYLFIKIYSLTLDNSAIAPEQIGLLNYFLLKPMSILQGAFLPSIILHMFTHVLLIHLAVNMFVLYSLGGLCEKIVGRKRYFWFYLISGIFAGVLTILLSGFFGTTVTGARIFGDPTIFMVGASGAIFAIAGLYMILLPKLKFMIIFLPFFSLPAYVMIPLVLFGFWILTIIFNLPIGNVAHFGGFLAGVFYGLYLRNKYPRKVMQLQRMFR
jgi:membrane associated rhomboid family serine protease